MGSWLCWWVEKKAGREGEGKRMKWQRGRRRKRERV